MRVFVTCGFCLALGLLAQQVFAEDAEWHAARSSPQPKPATTSPVSLERPVPVGQHHTVSSDNVRTVSFETAAIDAPKPMVRFQRSETAQPMPAGPALAADDVLGPPRPLITGNTKSPVVLDSDVVSRWVGGPTDIVGSPPTMVGDSGCGCGPISGDACGAVCCDACGPACCDSCCFGDGCCRDRGHFWVGGEYLLWAFKRQNVPPLVSANPNGMLPASALEPGTIAIYGNSASDTKDFSGGRLNVGFWCCHCPDIGFEGSYFFLGQLNKTFMAASDGSFSLGRPLLVANATLDALGNLVPPGENVEQVALAPDTKGSVMVATTSKLWGAEGNIRYKWCCGSWWHVDFLTGFRYVDLDESIDISENIVTTSGIRGTAAGVPTNILVSDRFGTHDQFYGWQFGLDTEVHWRRWFLGGQFKLAMGDMNEMVRIGGNTTFIPPAPAMPVNQNGGVLALASNIGTYNKNRFAVVPEVGLKVGLQVTDHLRLFAGYNFLYMSDVVRPADQIDRRVNTNQFPNIFNGTRLIQPALPAVLFKPTDFWAQGLNAGMEFRY